MMVALEFGVVGGAGEGDYVADVGHSGDEEHQTLEAQSESRVRHGAVTAGVEIPPHVLHGDAQLVDALLELVEVGLAFRAADYLADFWEEHVHGAHGAAVG